ncbi:zinc ribbon domain-containing protein YjdM [Cytophagales bacterium LB-30]|uniref:Zinc ribbon domain-containing protein YjdM n=1 Tax=Shiella aurantiaca TaxID=3058365 RepID=A0ABT8F2I6_9BACT|nr:zinc ribbon domain-containing protein YjdM [Shiella aurantiaca]MDN4164667.1 zinc ribbon domain-containing protein YjdM [Shiella aurantiaca]
MAFFVSHKATLLVYKNPHIDKAFKFADIASLKLNKMDVKDSNGTLLADGDSVTLIKDLKVKGTSTTLKRGKMVKNIRLTDNPDEIDCRIDKISMVLRTEFVKKA